MYIQEAWKEAKIGDCIILTSPVHLIEIARIVKSNESLTKEIVERRVVTKSFEELLSSHWEVRSVFKEESTREIIQRVIRILQDIY